MSAFPARPPRVATDMAATIRDSDGGTLDATVTNISASGCGLLADGSLETGETITVTIGAQAPSEAEVRWTKGRAAGARFTAPPRPL